MVFHSPNFLVFFGLLLLLFLFVKKWRLAILAAGNIWFYGSSGLGMLAVFVAVTALVFLAVHGMQRPGFRWLYIVGLVVPILNLVCFKYTLLLLETWGSLTGLPLGPMEQFASSLVLPVGISFYTFQLLAYLIDVRRGELEPTRSFFRFWVFISLFPQLIAGPIMRGKELMPQVDAIQEKSIRWQEIKYGMYLFFVGLAKKILIADPLSLEVNEWFAQGAAMSSTDAWLAAYGFGFQIYFDFSAYSDMAIGLGWMLGFRLIENFRSPYISADPSEFWRRWHISLSRWIRDYVYIGLGGNRKGAARTHLNLLAAMLISGLWHGAMWTFVLWGGLHGLLLILHKLTLKLNRWNWVERLRSFWLYRVVAVAVFFHVVTWTWVFFRAQDFTLAMDMTAKMLAVDWLALWQTPMFMLMVGLYALHLFEYGLRTKEALFSRVWHWVPFPIRGVVYAGFVLAILYMLRGETYDFIYFQF
ncbi:MBOAT family O-acyltransferase [Xylanibacillus composti]|uniref:Alginate O-acetyltransferase n=1 Tax=Xylanibacillus composti TaxID=1572762 RepID=A0A8J4H4N1_9BACL|nr:MBOAT family O-acyltransferase [Xylanibacillus composti]GIQ70888.1 alginate O-acetyltransferase [Xylanibacillus composti]